MSWNPETIPLKLQVLLVFLSLCAFCPDALAQNWRTPNPNQPNGYRATEAAYHYHGSYKEPSSPSDGYRASEARSHAGLNCFAPPSSSSKSEGGRWGSSEGGRFGGGESSRFGGGGGRFGSAEGGRFGDAAGGRFAGGESGRFGSGEMQNRQEEWNEFYKRRFEATEQRGYNVGNNGGYSGVSTAGNNSGYNGGNNGGYNAGYSGGMAEQQQVAPVGQDFNGYAQPGASFNSAQAMQAVVGASAVRRMLRNGENFNRVYNGNSGGFNRIYASE